MASSELSSGCAIEKYGPSYQNEITCCLTFADNDVRRGKINSFLIGLQTFVSFLLLVMLLEKCRAHERLRDTGASNETHCSCALSEDE